MTTLRALAGCGGCAAKAPPETVALLAGIAAAATGVDPNVLVGLAPADDAAVYALDAERALVATVDFFPPVVDDPADYGAVAAANAVSDVYAMGGDVAFALAVSGFPPEVPSAAVEAAARAAAEVVRGCGGVVLGGHSIRCREPVFGLCVFGFVHPARIWRKSGARPGDVLVLSKALGTGVLLSGGQADAERVAVASMRTTNRAAAAALRALHRGPSAVTDVTGFGLVGHAGEIARLSNARLRVRASAVPLLAGALETARAGVRTSLHRRSEILGEPAFDAGVPPDLRVLLQDPQTSGGLLAAVSPDEVGALAAAGFVAIGEVAAGEGGVAFV